MYRYLIIDGFVSGTGIRNYYEGGYAEPSTLALSQETVQRLEAWLSAYKNEHYSGFPDEEKVKKLDEEGKKIALLIREELRDSKIRYCSAATLKAEDI
jgi:hypothetical protein